jgi:hypothetical protein
MRTWSLASATVCPLTRSSAATVYEPGETSVGTARSTPGRVRSPAPSSATRHRSSSSSQEPTAASYSATVQPSGPVAVSTSVGFAAASVPSFETENRTGRRSRGSATPVESDSRTPPVETARSRSACPDSERSTTLKGTVSDANVRLPSRNVSPTVRRPGSAFSSAATTTVAVTFRPAGTSSMVQDGPDSDHDPISLVTTRSTDSPAGTSTSTVTSSSGSSPARTQTSSRPPELPCGISATWSDDRRSPPATPTAAAADPVSSAVASFGPASPVARRSVASPSATLSSVATPVPFVVADPPAVFDSATATPETGERTSRNATMTAVAWPLMGLVRPSVTGYVPETPRETARKVSCRDDRFN